MFKVGGSLLIGVALVGVAFYVSNERRGAALAEGVFAEQQSASLRTYQVAKDSDKDGRSDWQEELEGTDPFTPDPAPTTTKTYKNVEEIFSEFSDDEDSKPKTFTDAFARSYMEELIRAKYSSNPPSDDEIVAEAVASVEKAVTYKQYGPADINIIPDSDDTDARAYGNALGGVLETSVIPREMNPFAVILKGQSENDPEMLKRLIVYVEAFAYLRDNVAALSVPHTLVQEHLELLNTLSAAHDAFVYLKDRMFNDSLLSFGYTLMLREKIDGLYPAVDRIEAAFSARNIYYANDEPGNKIFEFGT